MRRLMVGGSRGMMKGVVEERTGKRWNRAVKSGSEQGLVSREWLSKERWEEYKDRKVGESRMTEHNMPCVSKHLHQIR